MNSLGTQPSWNRNFRNARNSERIPVCPRTGGRIIQFVDMQTFHTDSRQESRHYPRKVVAVPARLLLSDFSPNEVAAVDISEAGVGIIAASALQEGASCVVALDLDADGGPRRINAWGEIVYSTQIGPGRFRSGIRFTDMDSYSRLCISKLPL